MRWNALGQLYAGVGLSGIGPILIRLSPVDPAATAFWRLTLSCIPAAVTAWRSPGMPAGDIGLALLAGVMLAADLVLWNASIVRTSVLEATLLVMIYPLLVALLPALWLRRRPDRQVVGGGLVAFLGIAVLAGARGTAGGDLLGNGMALLAALFYAVCFLISATLCRRQDAAAVTLWTLVGATLGALPVALLQDRILPQDPSGWLNLAAQALIAFAAQILVARALRTLDAGFSAIAGYGQPVVATLLAWPILGQAPQAVALIGSVFIVAGIVLAGRGEAEPAAPARPGAAEPAR
ncbi:DMT family transporter [Inquilinus sp. Marseille-Q2685]|uniref:DMT family transporter n=1 Tax=Inquilinus sp. Marseille-Q2685 TaxID=2866581 RepID=UPI001CE4B2CC|nr:DMT family transporter [Inquilinus sp. Marseille-Q2685]